MTSAAKSAAVSTGRGLLFISLAKLYFMVAGYVIQFALPRALSPARFGVYVIIMAVVSTINNVMNTATVQGVSKFTAEVEERQSAVLRAALKLQALVGGGLGLGFFLLAPFIAAFEHDPALVPYFRLATGVILAYAFYAVFIGAANGRKEFHKQAGLDVTFSTLRCLFVVGAAVVTGSTMAAIGGFVAAAATILLLSIVVVGFGRPGAAPFSTATLARFLGGVAFYLFIVNLLMFTDGLLVKRLVAEWAQAGAKGDPTLLADTQAGLYGAVQNVARLPYQLILAVTFVVFPLVSQSTFHDDRERTRGYVRTTMRYSLLVLALMAAVLSARPDAVTRLLYKAEYVVAAPALPPLILGYVFFALFIIAGTIINGSGRTLPTTLIGLATLVFAVATEWAAIRGALASGADPLVAAAVATCVAMALGMLLSGIYLFRLFGVFVPLLSVARVALAYLVTLGLGRLFAHFGLLAGLGKLGTLLFCGAAALVFLGVLVLAGELRPAELARLRRRA